MARVERKAGEHILRHAGQEAEEDDVEPCHDLIIVEDCNVWNFGREGCGNGGVAGRDQDRVTLAFQRALPACITGEAGHFQAFLHRLGVAFAGRAAVDDAVNARSNQVFKLRHKGVSVDAAVSTVGRDGGRLDAFECHEAPRVSTTPGARPSGMVMLSGGATLSIWARDSSQCATASSAAATASAVSINALNGSCRSAARSRCSARARLRGL